MSLGDLEKTQEIGGSGNISCCISVASDWFEGFASEGASQSGAIFEIDLPFELESSKQREKTGLFLLALPSRAGTICQPTRLTTE